LTIVRLDAEFGRWPELLDLILAAFAFMDGRIAPPSSAHALTAAGLAEKASEELGFAVLEDTRLFGCMFLRPEADCLYIGKLAVAPNSQGRGIGRTLLDHAHREAERLRLPMLRLETRIELVENHRLFESWGFRRSREGRHAGFDRTRFIEMTRPVEQTLSGPGARD
jgi:GNAT superfamily N-acetyltransferase